MGDDDRILTYANISADISGVSGWATDHSIYQRLYEAKKKIGVIQVFVDNKAKSLTNVLRKISQAMGDYIYVNVGNNKTTRISWADLADCINAYKYVTIVFAYSKMVVIFGGLSIEFGGISESKLEKLGEKGFATIIE